MDEEYLNTAKREIKSFKNGEQIFFYLFTGSGSVTDRRQAR
jgi:hypothetical protein